MSFSGKKVLVTGGTGMIGSHLAQQLLEDGARVRVTEYQTPASKVFSPGELRELEVIPADLREKNACERALAGIDVVFQLAASLTGVLGNHATPVRMFTPNVLIQTNMIEEARKARVESFLLASSACVYASHLPLPLEEKDGLAGEPDENNEAHAWAKRLGELQARYYRREFDMMIRTARPFNSYGPRDNFHLKSSHVVASLIKKVLGDDPILRIWGDGNATRDFVYVEDSAAGMRAILSAETNLDVFNIASGREISIRELAELIMRLAGIQKEIIFEKDMPRGQNRRVGSVALLHKETGFEPRFTLEEGLKKTIEWYKENQDKVKEYEV